MNGEWRDIPESRELFKIIRSRIVDIEKDLGRGMRTISYASADNTALQTAIEVGKIQGFMEVLEICGTRVD